MTVQGILLLDLIGFTLMILILNLLHTRRLHVVYALVWLVAAFVMMIIISIPPLLDLVTIAVGARFPASALTLLAFVLVFTILILFSVQLSMLTARQVALAQAIALGELQSSEAASRSDETSK